MIRSVLSLARPCVARRAALGVRWMAIGSEEQNTIKLTFGSPGEAFYNEVDVSSINVVTMDGHVGLEPSHVPLLAALVPGVLSVTETDGKDTKFFVSSGGLTVNGDSSVQILAEEAVPLDQLDAQAIKVGMDAARTQEQNARTERESAEAEINMMAWESLSSAGSSE